MASPWRVATTSAVPASAALDAPQAFTLSAWIRHAPVTRFASILDKRDATDDGYDLYISERSNLFIRVNELTLEGTAPVADGAWHHVAGTWDGTRLTLYVDGQIDATQSVLPTAIDVTGEMVLGRNFASGFVFEGDLDEVRVYDSALGPEEILPLALPSGPTVTLPGWPDRYVVQRVGSSADLDLSGATTGTAAIEARVLDDATGQPLAGFDWTVVDPAPVDGAWSGQLLAVPEGGWYRLEARQAGDPASARSGQRFGVGVVVAAIGQSNMVKMFTEISFPGDDDLGTVTPATPDDLTRQYGYGNPRISATDAGGYSRLDGGAYGWSDVTGVGGVRLANNLAAELGLPVLLLDFAIDGTSIGQWTDPSWPNWQRFALALGDVGGRSGSRSVAPGPGRRRARDPREHLPGGPRHPLRSNRHRAACRADPQAGERGAEPGGLRRQRRRPVQRDPQGPARLDRRHPRRLRGRKLDRHRPRPRVLRPGRRTLHGLPIRDHGRSLLPGDSPGDRSSGLRSRCLRRADRGRDPGR